MFRRDIIDYRYPSHLRPPHPGGGTNGGGAGNGFGGNGEVNMDGKNRSSSLLQDLFSVNSKDDLLEDVEDENYQNNLRNNHHNQHHQNHINNNNNNNNNNSKLNREDKESSDGSTYGQGPPTHPIITNALIRHTLLPSLSIRH